MNNFNNFLLISMFFVLFSCQNQEHQTVITDTDTEKIMAELTLAEANRLSQLPLNCIDTEYPNKMGTVLSDEKDLIGPKAAHPAFYGCFDWHSSVHGHWSLVRLLKTFPALDNRDSIINKLRLNMSKANIQTEITYFKNYNKNFERTYGWAWLLKLSEELHTWDDPIAKELAENLQPLTDSIVNKYILYYPKLNYPIRVGTHTNTAFGMSFAWDYAETMGRTDLLEVIKKRALDFYTDDKGCPINWEPSGYDFLSPCFEEIDIMRRVLPKDEFATWLNNFMPALKNKDFQLEVGKVSDRADGHMVHLDGLNFSRAWCLYGLANEYQEYEHLKDIAATHIRYSLPSIVDENYEGTHWLASFAIFALGMQ